MSYKFHRTDGNQRAILEAFKAMGCTVINLSRCGGGVMDALISPGVLSLPIEIKNPAGRDKVEESQIKMMSEYTGTVRLVRSLDDVEETVALARHWRNLILAGKTLGGM